MSALEPVTVSMPPREAPIRLNVVGEMVTPELAVTPAINADQMFDGRFALTHVPSGMAVVGRAGCIGCAREAARLASASDVDWARDFSEVVADPAAKIVATQVQRILADCGSWGSCR